MSPTGHHSQSEPAGADGPDASIPAYNVRHAYNVSICWGSDEPWKECGVTEQQRTPLTRTAILEAGIALADTEGLGAVTMRRLGNALGVEAMSLYRHVENKQDVLDGMASLLVARMQPVTVSSNRTWQDVVHQFSWAYRRLIVTHPAVFMAQAGRPLALDRDQTAVHRIVDTLVAAGFPRDAAMDIYLVGTSYARGFALTDLAHAHTDTSLDGFDTDRAFERGLTVLTAGFEDLLATANTPQAQPPTDP